MDIIFIFEFHLLTYYLDIFYTNFIIYKIVFSKDIFCEGKYIVFWNIKKYFIFELID
jgi:hypothetical protein